MVIVLTNGWLDRRMDGRMDWLELRQTTKLAHNPTVIVSYFAFRNIRSTQNNYALYARMHIYDNLWFEQ